MSALPYSNTTSGDKALAEIQRILQRFGCNKFGVMTDWDAGTLMVQFEWRGARVSFPANFKGYATEEVFMAHMLLPNGQRMIEHAKASNLLPNKEG